MDFKLYMEDTVNAIIPYRLDELLEIKSSISKDDLNKLIKRQEHLVNAPLQTIVKNKKLIATDSHLYESLSIYTWPDPNTKDGLPYITRDGFINNDHLKNDKENLRYVSFITYHLGILYMLTEDQKYYEALKNQLFTFFINEETKILPDFSYGQAHLGLTTGCSGGIIDIAISFGYSLSILHALNQANMLEEELVSGMTDWLSQKLTWLEEHPYGEDMRSKPNNHSMVYDYYTLMIGLFINNEAPVKRATNRLPQAILSQIMPDGSMPLELKRQKSRSYTSMNSKLIFEVYKLSGTKLPAEAEQRLKKAIEFYLPYAQGSEIWPYQQTQYYYQFYDINFVYHAYRYFGYDNQITIPKVDIDLRPWTYYLNNSLLKIDIK